MAPGTKSGTGRGSLAGPEPGAWPRVVYLAPRKGRVANGHALVRVLFPSVSPLKQRFPLPHRLVCNMILKNRRNILSLLELEQVFASK